VAEIPVGLSESEVIRTLAIIEANGEINGIPPPQLEAILEKARAKMELKTQRPIVPPGPPGPPPLLNP